MKITESEIDALLTSFFRRVKAVRAAGGIPHEEVVNGRKVVPDGWVLDHQSDFWLPPNVVIF